METECNHFHHISTSKIRNDIAKRKLFGLCNECRSEEAWLCLSCSEQLCGRFQKGHMEEHCKNRNHPLVISLTTKQVWCYQCDADLDELIPNFDSESKRDKAEKVLDDIRSVIEGKLKKEKGRSGPAINTVPQSKRVPDQQQPKKLAPIQEHLETNPTKMSRIRGLSNLGNTCFFNSALQCLNATQPLVALCTEMMEMGRGSSMNAAFARTIEGLRSHTKMFTPSELHSTVVSRFRQFKGYGQHDSHELLRCLIDALATEQTKAKVQPNGIEAVFGGKLLSTVLCATCIRDSRPQVLSRAIDPIMDLSLEMSKKPNRQQESMGELLACWRRNITSEDFTGRPEAVLMAEEPDLGPEPDSGTLENCLHTFTRFEMLGDRDNLYACERCQRQSPAIRRLLIYRPPKVLVIHLKRFSSHGRFPSKLTNFISYPAVLDISQYCVHHHDTVIPRYRLYAISVHSGGINGGHYVAFVEHEGVWYHCSDSHVGKVAAGEVLRQQAYVLFYQAEDDREESTRADEHSEGEISTPLRQHTVEDVRNSSEERIEEESS